jgi:acyl-coenzyme A synthetase/AMP-(fatty) acid ligase
MSSTLPLLAARDLAQPLAWRDGQPIGGAQFLADAAALAERLPARGQAVNLCQDRYHFALALVAAALRGQVSLLPPNAMAATLQQLPAGDGAAYAMVDDDEAVDLPRIDLRQRPAASTAANAVPMIDSERIAVCLLTSGSTGAPQPHAKNWRALTVNIGAEAERLAQMSSRPSLHGMNIVATVPAQHSYGFESTVMLSLLGGAAFDAGRPFYPADVAQALNNVPRPRALVTTPFHLKTLLLSGVALPSVDLLLCATAPLTPQLAALAEQKMGGPLVEIYGCTEAGQLASRRTTQGQTWTTLGEVRITRTSQSDGETFTAHGGHVFEPTPLADILALHNEREFGLLGRANDLIHVAGKRSSLAHLNFHLNRIDGVEDGAFWLPDEVPGTVVRPMAFVVAPTLSAQAITQSLREHLEPAFVPRRVVHVGALPREATGKLTLNALRTFALKALADNITLHVPHDHPSFAGHFPGHPVLPGVVLLSMVMEALQSRLQTPAQIDQAKFLAPVLPGDTLALAVTTQGSALQFELKRGDVIVARGQLSALK